MIECEICTGNLAKEPLLKWAGGKRWLAPQLKAPWKRHVKRFGKQARLVEPFCGSLSVALTLNPERALLNDANFHLINLYEWLKKGFAPPITPVNDEQVYYEYREVFNTMIVGPNYDSDVAAYLFYYLNRTCFRGLCRFNSQGHFNTPYGHYKKVHYHDSFEAFHRAIYTWHFQYTDFEEVDIREGDFVYIDPPYDTPFTQFTSQVFTWKDQIRLAEWTKELADRGIPVITSNEATGRILKLYKSLGFEVRKVLAERKISVGDRAPAKEMVAFHLGAMKGKKKTPSRG